MGTKGSDVTNMIERIKHLVDSGEYNRSAEDFREARWLLNNELPQAIDEYVKEVRGDTFLLGVGIGVPGGFRV